MEYRAILEVMKDVGNWIKAWMDETKICPCNFGAKNNGERIPEKNFKERMPLCVFGGGAKEKMKTENTVNTTATVTSSAHLDFDEIVEYVSLNKLDEHALRLASKVDTHIRECDECLALVNAVEAIQNEFARLRNSKELEGSEKEAPVMDEELKKMLEDVRALKREQGGEN